jgi:putative transposase
VADARRELHHQLSTKPIRENQAVAVEDLAVKGLARTRLAKSVHDAGWAQFVSMLEYKAARYGRTFMRIGRFEPTSQVCSQCGVKDGPKPLSVRGDPGQGRERGGQRRQGGRTGRDSPWSAGKTGTRARTAQ